MPPLSGLQFVITGNFSEDRNGIAKKLTALGGIWNKQISSKTNLIIVGEDPGRAKLLKAGIMGINTVDRQWLIKALKLGGFVLKETGMAIEKVD